MREYKFDFSRNFMISLVVAAIVVVCFRFSAIDIEVHMPGEVNTINLDAGEKLELETVQQDRTSDLQYVTRPMKADEEPATYTFHKVSDSGTVMQTITLVEHKE